MIIKSIYLKEGLFERKINFSDEVTLIHSKKNSCGKTTLLRCILYGLGYTVPNTKKMKFNRCEITVEINSELMGNIFLFRNDESSIVMKGCGEECTFVLPEQELILHSKIFGTENANILSNILGAFYVDQEKGWTLLNRGIVIGSIRFKIEDLIRGLSGRDCTELIKKHARLQREKEKYKQMSSVAKYRESLEVATETVAMDSYEDVVDAELSELLIQQNQLKNEISRIDRTLSDNKRFKKFVAEMKLLIETDDGLIVPVTESNIVGLDDAISLLVAKRKMVAKAYADISTKIDAFEKEKNTEDEQLDFFKTASMVEIFDKKVLRMPLNQQAIQKEIDRLEKEIKAIESEIDKLTKLDNYLVKQLSEKIIFYGTEMGVGDKSTISSNYLFTSNLRELSGALLHKTAFAFRLAYISVIEENLNIKLPIILDSPSGKEIDPDNVKLMMNILKRDFADNQVIIASIFTYEFENLRTIEIKDRLIDSMIVL